MTITTDDKCNLMTVRETRDNNQAGGLVATRDVNKGDIMYFGGALVTTLGMAELPEYLQRQSVDLRKLGATRMLSRTTIDSLDKVETLTTHLMGSLPTNAVKNQVLQANY